MKFRLAIMALAAALALGAADAASAGGHGDKRGGWSKHGHWKAIRKVPEIDIFTGLAAMATLGGAGALVLERRRRRTDSEA